MPNFLNKPFSCAITMGEQSVSAIIPNFIELLSGASLAYAEPNHPLGNPANSVARVVPLTALVTNCRRVNSVDCRRGFNCAFVVLIMLGFVAEAKCFVKGLCRKDFLF